MFCKVGQQHQERIATVTVGMHRIPVLVLRTYRMKGEYWISGSCLHLYGSNKSWEKNKCLHFSQTQLYFSAINNFNNGNIPVVQ